MDTKTDHNSFINIDRPTFLTRLTMDRVVEKKVVLSVQSWIQFTKWWWWCVLFASRHYSEWNDVGNWPKKKWKVNERTVRMDIWKVEHWTSNDWRPRARAKQSEWIYCTYSSWQAVVKQVAWAVRHSWTLRDEHYRTGANRDDDDDDDGVNGDYDP